MSVVARWMAAMAALAWGLGSAQAEPPADAQTVLGAGSRWRYYVLLSPPMVSAASAQAAGLGAEAKDRAIGRIADNEHDQASPILGVRTPPPPQDWSLPGFDDLGWAGHSGPLRADPLGTPWPRELSPEYGVIFGRFKFLAPDPAGVKRLWLSAAFRGGLVAYLNGKEVARAGELPASTVASSAFDALVRGGDG